MRDPRLSIPVAVLHPVRAWRQFTQAKTDHADGEARDAGLTVEILPRGVRRYRDPRLDQLTAHRVGQVAHRCLSCGQVTAATPSAPVTAVQTAAGWGAPVTVDTGWSR